MAMMRQGGGAVIRERYDLYYSNFLLDILYGYGRSVCMTREQYQQMQMEALEGLKSELIAHRNNAMLLAPMRESLEQQYEMICKKQAEWEQGGFWTPDREKNYLEQYKNM
jgi:hypothetical protein